MTELIIKKMDPKLRIQEVAFSLKRISSMYGYKIPSPDDALDLTKFVIKNFPTLAPSEIIKSFEMVALNKINVNIESYGRILVIPILTSVLRSYIIFRNKENQRKMQSQNNMTEEQINQANIEARLSYLHELGLPGIEYKINHYNVIDEFIQRFPIENKIKVFREEKEREELRLKSLKPISRGESLSIKKVLENKEMLESQAKVKAQIRLVHEFLDSDIDIDIDLAIDRIKKQAILPELKLT